MRIAVGLELENEGRALAWALDYPGCFAYGDSGTEAVVALARRLAEYQNWANGHAQGDWLQLGDYDLRVVDTWQVYMIDDQYQVTDQGYAVNAWFKHDWQPLDQAEIARGLELLDWSRTDLLRLLEGLTEEQLDKTYPGERWSIRGIARHIANAEWWYLDRLNLTSLSREQLPKEIYDRLSLVRQEVKQALPGLAGRALALGKDGEFWSPRKLLRRLLWHEMDHHQHIIKLLLQSPS